MTHRTSYIRCVMNAACTTSTALCFIDLGVFINIRMDLHYNRDLGKPHP